jgi:thiosulfate/3-mercaptopyruvate sulfurtransferase
MSITFVCLLLSVAPPADYAKPELLADAAALVKTPAGLVLDLRARPQYLQGHIPGAVWINAPAWGKAFTPNASASDWEKRLGEVGVDLEKPVILCGGDDMREAARLWWILRYWGLKDVRILNGGWSAWQAAQGPVDRQETQPQAKSLKLTASEERLATKAQLLKLLQGAGPQILDVRSTAEYCGDTATARRNGSIPGAINLEWVECIDPKTKKIKSATELQKLFEEHKVDVNKPAITYCQSGGRASVMAFALELMGGNQVQNYYQSWAEWGNDPNTPIVKPAKK